MKKQMICSFLAISLAGMMCAGCSQSTEKKDLKLSSLDEKKGDDKNVELTVWGAKEDQELLKEIVDSFQRLIKKNTKVKQSLILPFLLKVKRIVKMRHLEMFPSVQMYLPLQTIS